MKIFRPKRKNFRAKSFNTFNKVKEMIELTKLNKLRNEKFILNCELIETIEEKPDTTIRLVNGKHFLVAESTAQVLTKVIAFKRKIYSR